MFFGSALIGSAGIIIVSTVSTVNRKDQMFLVLFAKVWVDSGKYFEKSTPICRNISTSQKKYTLEYTFALRCGHTTAYLCIPLEGAT